ncbi:MAG: type II secretion system protein J [Vulcanimicrobiota bacterium]
MKPTSTHKAFTLPEVLISACLLGLLTAAIFAIYRLGSNALMRTNAATDLVRANQAVLSRFSRDAEQTVYDSVTIGPNNGSVAFLSAVYDTDFQVDAAGQPLWQKYVVLYHDPATRQVLRREVPLASPTTTAAPISSTGTNITGYLTAGRRLASDIYDCSFFLDSQPPTNEPLLRVTLDARKQRYGRSDEERVRLEGVVRMRN